jgi:hypothetical protein
MDSGKENSEFRKHFPYQETVHKLYFSKKIHEPRMEKNGRKKIHNQTVERYQREIQKAHREKYR